MVIKIVICLFLLYGYYRRIGKPGISVVLTVVSLETRALLACLLSPIFVTVVIEWLLVDLIEVVYGIRKKKWIK